MAQNLDLGLAKQKPRVSLAPQPLASSAVQPPALQQPPAHSPRTPHVKRHVPPRQRASVPAKK